MEILGAVSGAITLADAAAKGVKFLQQIPEIRRDYDELCKEIAFIETVTRQVRENTQRNEKTSLGLDINDQINLTESVLGEVSALLNEIKAKRDRTTAKGGDPRPNTVKWLQYARKINTVLQKVRRAKTDLSMAMVNFNMAVIREVNARSLAETALHRNTNATMQEVHRQLEQSLPRIENMLGYLISVREQNIFTPAVNDSSGIHELDDASSVHDEAGNDQIQVHGPSPSHSTGGQVIQKTTFVAFRNVKCTAECACRCHAKPWRFSSPAWMRRLMGSWEVKCKPQVTRTSWGLRCLCSKSEDVTVLWQPPDWPLMKLFSLSRSYSFGLSLRPSRVIPWATGQEWIYIRGPAEHTQEAMRRGMILFPDDQDENGRNIIEVMIFYAAFEHLEIFLVEWENILPGQTLPRQVAYTAHHTLRRLSQNEGTQQNTELLRKVLSYVDDFDDFETTTLHDAARRGVGVQEELDRLRLPPASIDVLNTLDKIGFAPLHYAARKGDVQSLQQLIDAGADVNYKTFHGSTPLMLAAVNNETESMMQLLLANCSIQERNRFGYTALHEAARSGKVNAVRLLLGQGASATQPAKDGMTPLHAAAEAESMGATGEETEATIKLLLDAPNTDIDINAIDTSGNPSICFSLLFNRMAALRCLAQFGASFTFIDFYSQNLLHYAALFCNLEVLLFLDSCHLSGINWQLNNKWGSTPWDRFMFSINAHPWELTGIRKPTQEDMIAFTQLYRGIRDRELAYDISLLKQTLTALSRHDTASAHGHLSQLIKHKEDYNNPDHVDFYRGIDGEISSGVRQTTIQCIKDDIGELKDEMEADPWDQVSYWDSHNQPTWESEPDESTDDESIDSYNQSPEESESGQSADDQSIGSEMNNSWATEGSSGVYDNDTLGSCL